MDKWTKRTSGRNGQVDRMDKWTNRTSGQNGQVDKKDKWTKRTSRKNGRMNKMTEDNCRIGDQKVMTNTKGAPWSELFLLRI